MEWISVKDRLPPKYTNVLTLCKHGAIEGEWEHERDDSLAVFSSYYWQHMEWYATHWMPLPNPPEVEND